MISNFMDTLCDAYFRNQHTLEPCTHQDPGHTKTPDTIGPCGRRLSLDISVLFHVYIIEKLGI